MKPMKDNNAANDFPVICVGGSAGGLDAYIRLLRNLPADMGVAIVIVNHLRTVATRLQYDGDGAVALCGIKEAGGITIAQKPETASQPDMPESAIATGCIDFILSPEDISREILRIAGKESL
jgi:chemotaxis response regulator CheB